MTTFYAWCTVPAWLGTDFFTDIKIRFSGPSGALFRDYFTGLTAFPSHSALSCCACFSASDQISSTGTDLQSEQPAFVWGQLYQSPFVPYQACKGSSVPVMSQGVKQPIGELPDTSRASVSRQGSALLIQSGWSQ